MHFHACSLGEVKGIRELVLSYDSRISVITQTGFDEAKSFCGKVNFLAFEIFIPFWLAPCKALVVFEAEFWLMLFLMAKIKGAKVILINTRISEKSYPKYHKMKFFYRKIFQYVDEIFAQSKEDKTRLESLGATNIHITGNLKSALSPQITHIYNKISSKIIILASTHEKEEALLLKHFKLLKDEKLIIAVRHPERFLSVEKELKKYCQEARLSYQKFSQLDTSKDLEKSFTSDILLLDVLGELVNFYAISDVVVLCGSFIKGIGGHNPIEAAFFNKTIISGPFYEHHKSSYEKVQNIQICNDLTKLDALIHAPLKPTILVNEANLSAIRASIEQAIKE